MHKIKLNNEAVQSLPEGFTKFSKMDCNNHFYLDENLDLNIAYDWDYDAMEEKLINELDKFNVCEIIRSVIKFTSSFELVYGGYSGETFYEYYNFDGKKLTVVSGEILDLDEEDPDACYEMDTAIRYDGEATDEFLDAVNKLISEGDSFEVSTYNLDGNKIEV